MVVPSALALRIARARVDTHIDRATGEVTVTVCDGTKPAWQVGYPSGPDQAQLVADQVAHDVDVVACFVQMGLDAREGLRAAALAYLNARDRVDPEGERDARALLVRMLKKEDE